MRVAIIGGGTAGHMALAHLSKQWPNAQLVHLYDRDRPTIGVGEGTTPDFVNWLSTIGITFDDLVNHCNVTRKRGISFHGWGTRESDFEHEFLPRSQQAVHFSAARLPELLASRSSFDHINDSVESIDTSGDRSIITTHRGRQIDADLVIDARGFPCPSETEIHRFDWIPTNSALVTKSPFADGETITKAIARPLGWVFRIPLKNETSWGYVYNSQLTTRSGIERDFLAFLKETGVSGHNPFRQLDFPNFARRRVFDQGVFHIGNCASFLEPLEATAISVITLQLHLLSHWKTLQDQGLPLVLATDRINRIHEDTLIKISIFIAWHYAAGSQYDTPFWQTAKQRFQQVTQAPELGQIFRQFDELLAQSNSVSAAALAELNTPTDLERWGMNGPAQPNFGGYNKLSFSQLAAGLRETSPSIGPHFNLDPSARPSRSV
ncbi:tryptophan 7-halogenase [Planctomycetes bacterium K23_9]|uniref:Flavin-dependent tryptophan halogenase RebH n=1 Tax=Stieleria marina TaxID=1930275 RepID=A0A517NPW6_9BACT|nr:Flavin-dependent tryptophan halogenase RebH [Planctomycetes bacterium K23_9]